MIQKPQGFPDIVVCSCGIEDAHAEDLFSVQLGSEDAGIAVFQDLFRDSAVQLIFLPMEGKGEKKLPLREIAGKDFVLTEHGEGYRRELDRLLAEQDLAIQPVIEFGNPETIIRLVEKGIGLSFLPLFCAEEKVRNGQLFIVETDMPKVYMYSQLFYHKNKWITPQLKALLTYIIDYF